MVQYFSQKMPAFMLVIAPKPQ